MDFILIWLVPFIPQARVLCKSRLILFHINAPSKIILLPALKDRLSRCAKTCQGKIQDKVSINTTQSEASKLQEEMNVCVDQCCDTHREPRMFERMSETILQLQRAPST